MFRPLLNITAAAIPPPLDRVYVLELEKHDAIGRRDTAIMGHGASILVAASTKQASHVSPTLRVLAASISSSTRSRRNVSDKAILCTTRRFGDGT